MNVCLLLSTSKAKLVITVGGNIEEIFTPPYRCVCEVKQSTKRNLQRHIQGCKDRHPCESIEGILKLKLQKTCTFKNKHFSARVLPNSISPPAISSSLVASSTSSAFSASSTLSVSSASSASPASSTPLGNTQDQHQSILSRLEKLPTQDRLEDTVMGLRDEMSRNSKWTERTIGIHERRHHRQVSPYSSITALTPSPQRSHHRLSNSTSHQSA
ncbi:MAG: hypothetical protein JOS17DRAFT_776338 [Linnemannia elongata]|nr:MAG: hypothetical protein JOS17DRAFT_776338 [Linnemannia elongata]